MKVSTTFGVPLRRLLLLGVLGAPTVLMATLISPDQLTVCNSGIPTALCTGNIVTATVTTSNSTTIVMDVRPNANFLLWDTGVFGFNWVGPSITVTFSGTRSDGGAASISPSNGMGTGPFGPFSNYYDSATMGGLPAAGLTDLVVTITGTGLSLADFVANSGGHILSSHVAPISNLSATGYVTDGGSGGGGGGGGGNTPEPVTFLLTGSGLIAAALVKRNRFRA